MQQRVSMRSKIYGGFLLLALLAVVLVGTGFLSPGALILYILALLLAGFVLARCIYGAVRHQIGDIRSDLRASEFALVATAGDLDKKHELLMAVVSATRELIGNSNFEAALGHAIRILGQNMQVSEVNVYKNELDANGHALFADQLLRWEHERDIVQHRNPAFQRVNGLNDIWDVMAKNEIFCRLTRDIKNPAQRRIFETRGVVTMAGIPLFVMGAYWGFVGFNDFRTEREWADWELSILRSFATTLGSVIERSQIEQQLIIERDRAETASNTKSEFMANISHELRTPMNGIIGFTDLVLTTDLQKTQREYLLNVGKSAHNLLGIINDILDFSKIESGKLTIDKAAFDLQTLTQETAEMMSIKAQQKNLELVCRIDPTLPAGFLGDQHRIRQILINLIGNAIKFTSSGEILVSLTKINPAYERDGKRYQDIGLSVADTGIGIDTAKLATIFDSFTQADSSTTRRFGGTGLGLTISKSLAELMGGSIDVASEKGRGSIFTLRLNLEMTEEQPLDPPVLKVLLKEVLVIDDNETNCRLLEELFGFLEIPCKVCNSGKDALRLIRERMDRGDRFDLIVTDHQMPEMDGITLISEIKRLLKGPDEPYILMLSSLEKLMVTSEAEKLGIHKFLSKPVSLNALVGLLSSTFEKPGKNKDFSLASRGSGGGGVTETFRYAKTTKVLVAEDDPINMLLIGEVLRRMNLQVLEAADGRQVLAQLVEEEPALIFMDINMPLMDGYECARAIRKMPQRFCDIPIVALTADAMEKDKERCLQAGMNDFLSKPFQVSEIEVILNKYLLPRRSTAGFQ
jgi:signal transduction histidine kinase/CheY-like chemotaxis protein